MQQPISFEFRVIVLWFLHTVTRYQSYIVSNDVSFRCGKDKNGLHYALWNRGFYKNKNWTNFQNHRTVFFQHDVFSSRCWRLSNMDTGKRQTMLYY